MSKKDDAIQHAKEILGDDKFILKKCNSERDVKAEVRRFLRRYEPIWLFMPVQSGFGVAGTPDFVGCYMGFAFGIETKFGTAKSTPIQTRQQDIMWGAGATVFRDVSERRFHAFIEDWEKFVVQCGGMVK